MQLSTLVIYHPGVIITISVVMAALWKHPLDVHRPGKPALRSSCTTFMNYLEVIISILSTALRKAVICRVMTIALFGVL